MSGSLTGGVWKKDSVKDVAESVGISTLSDDVAQALAGDVEFRLWEIIEESIKFMQHSRRTRLRVEDVDHALKARNLEPLWGFASTSHIPFKRTVTGTGTVYHLDDEEIDLSKVLKMDMPTIPRDVSFSAHWLAIEGVQPLIKENPTPSELAKYASRANSGLANITMANSTITPLVKHVLSRELQIYFARLTEALAVNVGGGDDLREAALGSLRTDPGLHQLVPYLIGWGGEQVTNHLDNLGVLQRTLDLFHAILDNPTLFIEPYLHQLTPPILTCLLTSALPTRSPSLSTTALMIRTSSASLLSLLLSRFSHTYPSLLPRVTKTLLRGLGAENRGLGGRWGAALGLSGVIGEGGNRAVSEWVGGSLKELGMMIAREEESEPEERDVLVREIFNLLRSSLSPIDGSEETPQPLLEDLEVRYGPLFGRLLSDRWEEGGREIEDNYMLAGNEDGVAHGGEEQGGEEEASMMDE